MNQDKRTKIPSINQLVDMIVNVLDIPANHQSAVTMARIVANSLRERPEAELNQAFIKRCLAPIFKPGPQPVINGTGILLHTNLGRSPLSREVLDKAIDAVAGYTDLEFDLVSGKRGHRDRHFAAIARQIWGCEDATLVNNAAAGLCLSLAALASGKESIVSRGELIEIGGSFRLPDIMAMAGSKLIEVGTTNKTKITDYEKALSDQTACICKVHPSNYRVEGFTADVSLGELTALGKAHNVPVIMDMGSGLSRSLTFPDLPEPTIEEYFEQGPDILLFSGDKLFGGSQAGIILGTKEAVTRLRKHPMMRMLRLDKLSISLLCHQLQYTFLGQTNPLAQLALQNQEQLRTRAQAMVSQLNLNAEVIEESGYIGGGSLPQEQRPSVAVKCRVPKTSYFAKRLRLCDTPMVGYVRDESFYINLCSVFPEQDQIIIDRINELMGEMS